MKENVELNLRFIKRHIELLEGGKTLKEMAAIIAPEFTISNHTYRAWKSRLYLQYDGRYKAQMEPFMNRKTTVVPVVQVTEVAIAAEVGA